MKTGILSMQRINNYGSFLQAYALKRTLEKMGHEVGFVDIEYKHGYPKTDRKTNKLKSLKKIRYIDRYILKRLEYRRLNRRFDTMMKKYQEKVLKINGYNSSAKGYDAVVIGSDEIFNCDSESHWGITLQRFGGIYDVPTVISYAASCGYTSLKDIDSHDRTVIKKGLENLKAVSVRDENTYNFALDFNTEPFYNLDPVLIYDFRNEIKKASERYIPDYPFMIVYAYHNRIESKEEISAIKKYARKKGLRIIAIGGSLPWCDEFAIINPFRVLAYFQKADCIVTDTFHGTVMAAKFNKPVAVLVRESNRNKLDDLLTRLHITDRKVENIREFERIIEQEPDYTACNRIIEKGRTEATRYLKTILCESE